MLAYMCDHSFRTKAAPLSPFKSERLPVIETMRAPLLLIGWWVSVATATEIVTTTGCARLRTENFRARMDLFYFYQVEFEGEKLDLVGLEKSIAVALSESLTDCNIVGEPDYAIEISGDHAFSQGGRCTLSLV